MRKPSAIAAMMTILLGTSACAASAAPHAASSQAPANEAPINIITLEPDVARVFKDARDVNTALRRMMTKQKPRRKPKAA